jgi:hypothetical protein
MTGIACVYPLACAERAKVQGCVDNAALAGAAAQSEVTYCASNSSDPFCKANIDPAASAQAYAHANGCDGATIAIGGDSTTVDASSSASGFGMIIPVSAHAKAQSSPNVALVQ